MLGFYGENKAMFLCNNDFKCIIGAIFCEIGPIHKYKKELVNP
jgi:hypothetical protein